MLGRFTRWLRMLGCDVTYFNEASDDRLLELAETEDRVLLTRDQELFQRAKTRGVDAHYLAGQTTPETIAEVAKRYQIRIEVDPSLSRCPTCGSPIRPIEKAEVHDRVPTGTFKQYDKFWICTSCGQVYWRGSHWNRITETLEQAKTLLRDQHAANP
jgi:uncharacterized protein with PIN domain